MVVVTDEFPSHTGVVPPPRRLERESGEGLIRVSRRAAYEIDEDGVPGHTEVIDVVLSVPAGAYGEGLGHVHIVARLAALTAVDAAIAPGGGPISEEVTSTWMSALTGPERKTW